MLMKRAHRMFYAWLVVLLTMYKSLRERVRTKPHGRMTLDLMRILDGDSGLKAMMEKSLRMAARKNPDPDTNPAQDLKSLYDFLDWAETCMPWNVLKNARYPRLYDHVDQSVDYFWFLVDQPLPELEGLGYYYPSLQYHEPIAGWCRKYASAWGAYLDTEDSWNEEYYHAFCMDKDFQMDKGWYPETNIWRTWNEFFSRHLVNPGVRPIAEVELVAPADSKPQGVWQIDEEGNLEGTKGVAIKSGTFHSISQLIGPDSAYCDAFRGGTFTHTFLDVNDYHRYHFPVDGEVLEVRKVPGTNAAGGVTIWDEEYHRYRLLDQEPGWQMIETRDCLIMNTEYGLVAILPVGMSQICSCNWEAQVVPGARVKKGDPMGFFQFGGSDIAMVFQAGTELQYLVPAAENGGSSHVLMGEAYARLRHRRAR